MFLEQLDRLSDDEAAATGSGRRPAGLDAHHAIVAFDHVVFRAQFLGMELHRLQRVDDCRSEALGQREGRIVLGVAADLQHALAELRERDRQVRRRRALADAALAVDREHFRGPDLNVRIEFDLHRAGRLSISDGDIHATSATTPSRRSSISSPASLSEASMSGSGFQ